MLYSIPQNKQAPEGYVYVAYGHPRYLKHVLASVVSLRRYDRERPVALVCDEKHQNILKSHGMYDIFDVVHLIDPEHVSIVGFKHNLHNYLFFENNLFLDSDMVWCKDPDALWQHLGPYSFTITGTLVSDNFFGGPKNIRVVTDILFRRRQRTLKHFGLTYLSRVQTGMIFAQDHNTTKKVCELARQMLARRQETHFRSRTEEKGRSEESCEWSLAMAMSKLDIPVYPWLQGHTSPQLDYIEDYTSHDPDFNFVEYTYFCDLTVNKLRGIQTTWVRRLLKKIFFLIPGKNDYMIATPYLLHFGWRHEKQPFFQFAERVWNRLNNDSFDKEQLVRKQHVGY